MPKKAKQESPEEQVERFRAEVERLVADGELDRAEADAVLDKLVRQSKPK